MRGGNSPLHVLFSVFDKGARWSDLIGDILLGHSADPNSLNSDGSGIERGSQGSFRPGARTGQERLSTCFKKKYNILCYQFSCFFVEVGPNFRRM